jgi:hypothetical protein
MQPLVMPNEICRLLSGAKTARVTEKGLHAMITPFVFWLRDIFLRTDADAASDRVVRCSLHQVSFSVDIFDGLDVAVASLCKRRNILS